MLQDKHILLGVSGGIAVYKAIELASLLTKAGAQVKTIMTANAMEFVSPLSFKSITKQSVSYKLFDEDAPIEHISLADWADIFIIAPATANIIGKIANGIADDLLSTSIMAGKAKKIIVPAMNINMYENPIVQKNITFLKTNGYLIMEPETGYLAGGIIGKGRFPDPVEILDFIKISSLTEMVLQNKKVLITAGASREKIDPMRFISNRSSGKMGISLAKTAYVMGAEVKFIHAYIEDKIPYYIEAVKAETANEMYNAVMNIYADYDIIIMCAAVADYTIENPATEKIKKANNMSLSLVRTKDILFELGQIKHDNQLLIGFAAESENIIENGMSKLIKKNCTCIVANSLYTSGKHDTEQILIFKDKQIAVKNSKLETACHILKEISQ